jgi:hypothetical protein
VNLAVSTVVSIRTTHVPLHALLLAQRYFDIVSQAPYKDDDLSICGESEKVRRRTVVFLVERVVLLVIFSYPNRSLVYGCL